MDWIKKNWKFLAVVAVAVLVLAVVIIAVMPDNGNLGPAVVETVPPDGAETGVYYFDTAEGEYVLSLNTGNVFTIAGPTLNKSGKYTVTANGFELDFIRDEDGTGTITKDGTVLTLQYKDKTLRFVEKVTYAVSFNSNGGSAVESVDVLNGKTVSKPADPKKDGSVFIGWYADADCTVLYDFSAQAITANTTVYAKWAEPVVGQNEYTVDFDLGYEAEGYEAMATIGGKLYNIPTPEREGYTFGGWWISMTEDGEKLTYKYFDELVFQANTTLFALWQQEPAAGSLEAPQVEVFADVITWNTIKGASTYNLKITSQDGQVVVNEPMGTTKKNYNFNELAAGEYTIEVTAVGSTADKTSETTVRHFVNKALDRVSLFTVIDGGILLWNSVDGAEKYLVTIGCGDDKHEHTLFDNGESTTYFFGGCAMQPGGITFTVTAVADGKADSVSETFVYERKLDSVGQILYNEETQSFYWSSVANASKYVVTYTINGETTTIDNGSATTFSVKNLSGEIALSVVPATKGYNSPEAATTTYNKLSLATPTGLSFGGTTVSWNPVAGANGYMVKINGQSFSCDETTFDIEEKGIELQSSINYEISVMAVGASSAENSLYSDVVTAKYLTNIDSVTYKNNIVTWTPVLGVNNYQVRVNGIVVANVSGTNSAVICLNKAGVNVIEVRYTDLGNSPWTSTEVYAYEVVYNTRSDSGIIREYVAIGDAMHLPDSMSMVGYEFTGWYNSPDAAAGNGAVFTDNTFSGNSTLMLYGNWTAKTYYVEFVGLGTTSNMTEGETLGVQYLSKYQLPVPVNPNAGGEFIGWYTEPNGGGVALTDSLGKSIATYSFTRDTYAYPFFDIGVLSFELQADQTYAVTKGPNLASAAHVRIPEYYRGIPVTTIMENAFYGVSTIEKLEIPATIKVIGTGAIPTSRYLMEINVYTEVVQTNYETFYSSYDGALLRHDMGTVYLEAFPRGKTGTYVIPDNVNVVRDKVFRFSQISKLIVGNNVTQIMQNAFYGCSSLRTLEFKEGGTSPLTIDSNAFYNTNNLTTIRLPARVNEFNLQILNTFARLTTVEVEEGGLYYSSNNNTITNAAGTAILYAPTGVSGEFVVPMGISEIGEMAFVGRTNITKVTIPAYVDVIGYGAFQGCTGLTEVVIEGGRNNNLTIGNYAFTGCASLTKITFAGNSTGTFDRGVTTVGNGAFTALPELTTLIFEAGANVILGDSAFGSNAKLENPVYNDGANIVSIGNSTFANCTKLTMAYIPATTTSVGPYAFNGCTNIEEVVFAPNGQQVTFGGSVFSGCERLTKVTLPATLSKFDASVFSSCAALTDIVVDSANTNFITYEGALYTQDGSELLFYPKSLEWNMDNLHPNLQRIGDGVFKGNLKITGIVLSEKVTYIGYEAFSGCTYLSSVTIAQTGTELTIGDKAFYNCTRLTAIELPDYTSSIGASAFELSGLTSFKIPAGITVLNSKVLRGTKIQTIEIPANVETIADGVFASCTRLATITFEKGTKPLTIGTLENSSVSNGVFFNTIISTFEVDDRITLIGAYAFCNQTSLTTVNMTENSQLTAIGKYAFAFQSANSSRLYNVTLGPKVQEIHEYAFHRSKIANITIPKSVNFIGKYAFAYAPMTGLNFEMDGTTDLSFDLTIKEYAFANTQTTQVTFPARLTSAYELIDLSLYGAYGTVKNFYLMFNGNEVLNHIDVEEGCKNYYAEDGILYEMDEFGNPTILLYCPRAKTGDVTIRKEVRKVENGAFGYSSLSTITFEEYSENDPEYGQPLLELGGGKVFNVASAPPVELAVFSPNANANVGGDDEIIKPEKSTNSTSGVLSCIKLPSHLGVLGFECFRNLTSSGSGNDGGGEIIKPERSITRSNSNANSNVVFNMDAHLTAIEGRAFDTCVGITVLDLPSVDELGGGAFVGMTNVTSVTFGPESNLKTLPNNLLSGCTKLTTFTVPASVTKMGEYVFYNCTSLTSITFEEGSQLSEIGNRCFQGTGLTSITLPQSVTYMGEYAFYSCNKLKTVNLSKSLVFISKCTFYNCPVLEAINVPDNSQYLCSVDGVVYDVAKSVLYAYPQAKDPTGFTLPDDLKTISDYSMTYFPGETLVLPETLEKIGDFAFESSHLKTLHIPASVNSIGQYAFYQRNRQDGYSLEVLTFAPDSNLKSIAKAAFRANTKLKELDLPDGIGSIGYEAFSSCLGLEKVMLPAKLTTLDSYAFYNCPRLVNITIQQSLHTIGQSAFGVGGDYDAQFQSLTEIVIPASITDINANAFENQTALKSVTFAEGCRLTTLGAGVFKDCVSLESITLPASLTTISYKGESGNMNGVTGYLSYYSGLFDGCVSLKSVDMSACVNLRDLTGRMFQDCSSLETVILPPNLTKIGDHFFGTKTMNNYGRAEHSECTVNLKEIVIPASVTYIGGYAFSGCTSLETVIFAEGSTMTALGSTVYDSTKPFAGMNIFADTPALKNVVLPQNLTVIGTSCFENSAIENVDLPSTIVQIGDRAFKNCENLLDAGVLPSLQYLGDEAFFNCVNMKTAELSFGLEYLGSMAFGNCTSLKYAHIPATVTSISGNPYMGCSGVENFDMDPDNSNFTVDENGVLYDRQMYTLLYYPASLTADTFQIPDTVHKIAAGAFAGAQLKNLVIPTQITVIPDYAFYGSGLETVTFHANITSLGDHAFDGCVSLNNVQIPNTLKQLGDYAFANCTSLTNFTFEDIPEGQEGYAMGEHFFDGCTAMTQVILPNALTVETTEGTRSNCIPGYMFANTGIVNAVIPANVVNISTVGVFYNCKQLETVTFETKVLEGDYIGALFFYGCSKLKEVVIPYGLFAPFGSVAQHTTPGLEYAGNYVFGECTSLEKVTVYSSMAFLESGMFTFYNCSSLKEINIMLVQDLAFDEFGNVTEYIDVSVNCFGSVQEGAFHGCSSLKNVNMYAGAFMVSGNPFEGSGFETLHFEVLRQFAGYEHYGFDDTIFAGMSNLKEIFIGELHVNGFIFSDNVFADLENDVNIYFYNYTREEVMALCAGGTDWLTNASEKAHFYFKDDMPEGVEIPESIGGDMQKPGGKDDKDEGGKDER